MPLEKLGPYRLEKLLGKGGMGTVFLGVHEETGARVAVKVLTPLLANNRSLRDRFAAEIETLKKLKHPNIVELFGYGEEEGNLFYSMELVEGHSLEDELRNGRVFNWREAAKLGIEICQALKHAHDNGVIHRDLKPANLLLLEQGPTTVKLSDFGIAKLYGATNVTAAGSVIGTADYMSPEQAEGQPVTVRSDLFSLGSVLFALLTRRTPFLGKSLPAVLHAVRFDEAPPVRQLAPETPEEFECIIRQLLEKDAENRFATALQVAKRLKAMEHALSLETKHGEPATDDAVVEVPDVSADELAATQISKPTGSSETPTGAEHNDAPTSLHFHKSTKDDEIQPTRVLSAAEQAASAAATGRPGTARSDRPNSGSSSSGDFPATSTSRFTAVDERERRRAAHLEETDETAFDRRKMIGMAVALATILAVIVVAVWPASADSLYRRIATAARGDKPRGLHDVKGLMDEFLRRFPHDSRRGEVEDWSADVECDWLQTRLALAELKSGGSQLEPVEKAFLAAMRLRPKKPAEALARFRELIDEFDQPAPPQSVRRCVTAARHQLKRLSLEP